MSALSTIDKVLICLNDTFSKRFPETTYEDGSMGTNITPYQEYLTRLEIMCNAHLSKDETNELELVLEFLLSEKFIKEDKNNGTDKYAILLKGRIFIEQHGGFVLKNLRETNAAQIGNQRENALMYGTWAAGVGGVSVAIMEAIKYWKWVSSIHLWTAFFLLFACTIAVLIVLLLTQHLTKLKNKE